MACLSKDPNKLAIFTDGLDGHCMNALGYFREQVAEHMPLTGDTVNDVKKFFDLQEAGHKELKAIRQNSKPATFGLSYGAFPKKVAATLKVPIEEATEIFNRYHNVLYPGVTRFRENYVLPTAHANGQLHLGLGCYLKSDNPDRDIRTLANGTCQFWSIITAITINRMHQLSDAKGLSNDIKCISTIYDSIYYEVTDDLDILKWLNDNIVPIITQDFIESQAIPNAATGEIGYDWASLKGVPINATTEQIAGIRESLRPDI